MQTPRRVVGDTVNPTLWAEFPGPTLGGPKLVTLAAIPSKLIGRLFAHESGGARVAGGTIERAREDRPGKKIAA